MRSKLTEELKNAMKEKDKIRLSTLRLILAAIKDRDIAQKGAGKDMVSDADILEILSKMVKQRRESIVTYQKAGRNELAEQEAAEIDVIEQFLPKQMSEAEIEQAVSDIVTEINAEGLKDMGRTMGALKERFAGQMDFATAGAVAKRVLQ